MNKQQAAKAAHAAQAAAEQAAAAAAAAAAQADAFDMWLASDESNVTRLTDAQRLERAKNIAVYAITLKGFTKAFSKVTRAYNAETNKTRLTISTFAYDDTGKRVRTFKKTLSLWALGDKTYHMDSSESLVIKAFWHIANAYTAAEQAASEFVVGKVNNESYPLWGINDAVPYIKALRESALRGFNG